MTEIDPNKTTAQLLQLAADYSKKRLDLTDEDRLNLVALLKKRAQDELDLGQEIECENVRVIRRVTGAVGVYFNT